MQLRLISALGAVLYLAAAARADLIVYESFDYAAGLPIVQIPGTGTGFAAGSKWNVGGRGASFSNWMTTGGSLSYPGLPVANNSVSAAPTADISGAYRDTAAAFVGGASSVSY